MLFIDTIGVLLARVVELVDTRDLKSLDRNIVPVQVRPRVPLKQTACKYHFRQYINQNDERY